MDEIWELIGKQDPWLRPKPPGKMAVHSLRKKSLEEQGVWGMSLVWLPLELKYQERKQCRDVWHTLTWTPLPLSH